MTALSSFGLAVRIAVIAAVSAIEVYTSKELQVKNGTDTRLKCTFSSYAPLGDDVTVAWTFQPLSGGSSESVFYFHREPFPTTKGRFQNRAVWDGNIKRNDGSIIIRNIQQTDNGTYFCQVKNPPDAHGETGEIMVSVVDQVKFSEILLLGLVIGIGSVVIILMVITVVLIRYYRKQRTHSTAVSLMECTEKLNDKSCDKTVNA
ncbi:myelin protein zero-like protein 2 [Bufo bufo]|uniref:myelin protein zero-like protein 2 n=1 Tax=Bufo bufo TaxID=8384 RepID=UPI001ABED34C|nr:myelin protein zero-like protein 2 [Bufo bufo]